MKIDQMRIYWLAIVKTTTCGWGGQQMKRVECRTKKVNGGTKNPVIV